MHSLRLTFVLQKSLEGGPSKKLLTPTVAGCLASKIIADIPEFSILCPRHVAQDLCQTKYEPLGEYGPDSEPVGQDIGFILLLLSLVGNEVVEMTKNSETF